MVAANFLHVKSPPPLSKIVLCQQTIALKAHCSLKPLFPSRNLLENEPFLDFLFSQKRSDDSRNMYKGAGRPFLKGSLRSFENDTCCNIKFDHICKKLAAQILILGL